MRRARKSFAAAIGMLVALPAIALLAALLSLALCAGSARAAVIWSEDFESGSGLSDGKWATLGTAAISSQGNASAHGVSFGTKTAGANLISADISVGGSKDYWISADFKERGAGGWLQAKGYNNGGSLKDTWLVFGDSTTTALTVLHSGGSTYYHYVQKVTTSSPTRVLNLYLADNSSNSTPVGHVFFDNLQVSDTAPASGTTARRVRWNEVVQ